MSRKKTGRSVKKTSSIKSSGQGRFTRFLKSVFVTAVASFGISTAWLHPQGFNWQSVEPFLVSLGWPIETQQGSVPVPASVEGYVQTSFAQCPQFFPGSRPVVPMAYTQRELCFSAFAILHSGQTKTPVFVAQRLNRQQIQSAKGLKRTDRFYAEGRLPQAERAELNDYRGSGFSRGHMAPAGDMASAQGMAQSFSLANMVPQNQIHNAGPWNKIEADTRKYIARAAGNVYVFTGPVFERNAATIGSSQVAVPTHLFKLVYDATTRRSWVHWQANHASTRVGPPISYEEFVRRTGLHLLPDLSLQAAG